MERELKNARLSFCCQENWNGFEVIDDRTRRCGSCSCKVIDFTQATQEDYDRAYASGQKVCGRFKASQLNEAFLKLTAASLVVGATLASAGCTNPTSSQQTQPTPTVSRIVMGMPPVGKSNDPSGLWLIPKIIPDPARKLKKH